ncbi:hypothetical protein GCM10023187_14980 [Nibrella viscosa]|uniref:Uncharacterized protein n=1 Tax=Nibrella viscosa TaxID=1084524 RepID=A0ABP8K6T4_9BACT
MNKIGYILLFGLWSIPIFAQNGTDIYLLDLSASGGRLVLSNPRNITKKAGYDNQPFFHPAEPVLYYTSMMADNQTDIWSYNLRTSIQTQLTNTPDSEYSPTVLPDRRYLSCIVQRKGSGDQDLVKYRIGNTADTKLILASQKTGKIGYQAWLNTDEAVVFVLGEPASLHYLNFKTKRDTLIATQIGRSLHRIPQQNALSFVQQVDGKWMIRAFDPASKRLADLAESAPDSDHYNAWTSDGLLLESWGNGIVWFDPKSKQWQPVLLPENLPRKKITRMAVQGNRIAIVLDE